MTAVLLSGVPIYVEHGLPPVDALGIRNGRVVASGSVADVSRALPPGARHLRATTGAIMPAFIDAHQHAYLVAVDPYTDALHSTCRSIPELLARLRVLINSDAANNDLWLRYHGYTPLDLAEHRSPTAAELDLVCAERPLHVLSRTFHESAVNSAGLAALGIGRDTPDPPGGSIVKDRRGRPTGVLLEASSFAAERESRPSESDASWLSRLAAYGRMLLSHGITRIADAAVPETIAEQVVSILAAEGISAQTLLTSGRIDAPGFRAGQTAKILADGGEYCPLCLTGRQVARIMRASARASVGPERVTARALGRRSGMPRREPDRMWHTGLRYPQEEGFASVLAEAADTGSALAVHAVGNGAVDAILSAREADRALADQVPMRMEHAMVVDPTSAARIGASGVPVISQPGFLQAFGHDLSLVPVPEPLQLMPFRSLLDAGVPLVFSSDYPAANIDPWQTVASAVLRRDHTGTAIHPHEVITVAEALRAHTCAAADVLGDPDGGRITPGSAATMIWCDTDPYRVSPEVLASIKTLTTWVDGAVRHGEEPPSFPK